MPEPLADGEIEFGTSDDLRDFALANRHIADVLADIRAEAGKWSASATALLGATSLAALTVGPSVFAKQPAFWKVLGEVCFFVGTLTGIVALVLSALAAQKSFERSLGGTVAWREQLEGFASRALCQLRWARRLTIAALVGVSIAAATLWFAPEDGAKRVYVTLPAGDVCGYLDGDRLVARSSSEKLRPDDRLVVTRHC